MGSAIYICLYLFYDVYNVLACLQWKRITSDHISSVNITMVIVNE